MSAREQVLEKRFKPPSTTSTSPSKDFSANSTSSTPPVDPEAEAINAIYEAFEAADYEGKIALFYQTLDDEALMDGEMAFEMLIQINEAVIKRGERERLDEMVTALRERSPQIYEEESQYLLTWQITNALASGHLDRVAPLVCELSTHAGDEIDLYLKMLDQLAYHGQLGVLLESVNIAWPVIKDASGIFPWAIDELAQQVADYVIFDYLEQHPSLVADDPELLARVDNYIEIDREGLAQYLAHLTNQAQRAWTGKDFKMNNKGYRQNLIDLSLEFLGYLKREKGIPYSKGELAREQLCAYFLSLQKGNLGKRDRQVKIHPLCPDHATLDRFLGQMMNMINHEHYKAVATFELIPAWLHFLAMRQLITDDILKQTLKQLNTLSSAMINFYSQYRDDPALYPALKSSSQDLQSEQ